jgi:Na+/H+ antiporter NhaD/arsenite permease-like protein
LGALYVIAGGIAVQGQYRPTPIVNVSILAFGAVLANFIGTTGASMLLIQPLLRINLIRQHRNHLPIFFIILVSNLGGLLTPLGDPPLFLGFLSGVEFFWTLSLWREWLFVNGLVLGIALVWDSICYRIEPARDQFPPRHGSFVLAGSINLVFLVGVIAAVLARSEALLGEHRLDAVGSTLILIVMGILSLLCTSRSVREHNHFSWAPMIEVAVLFAGIFVTMVPALALLTERRNQLGLTHPWQYFWLTGLLSAFLDNAPTYMTFAVVAAGGQDLGQLSQQQPQILQAISAGAVFMGALTYIGNGPNFMVKAIAEEAGVKMPSFFGYLGWSTAVLVPVLLVASLVFF